MNIFINGSKDSDKKKVKESEILRMATLKSRYFTKLKELYNEPQKNVSSVTAWLVLIPFPGVSPAATQPTAGAQLLKVNQ